MGLQAEPDCPSASTWWRAVRRHSLDGSETKFGRLKDILRRARLLDNPRLLENNLGLFWNKRALMKKGQEVPKSSETTMYKGFREGTCWRNRSLWGPSKVPWHLPLPFCSLPRKNLFPAQGKSFSSCNSKNYTLIGSFLLVFGQKICKPQLFFVSLHLHWRGMQGNA